jgi:hypothetical protein
MKLCKDCRWAALDEDEVKQMAWHCSHPSARFTPDPDYVTGKPVNSVQLSCKWVRWDEDRCGAQGKHWEPR